MFFYAMNTDNVKCLETNVKSFGNYPVDLVFAKMSKILVNSSAANADPLPKRKTKSAFCVWDCGAWF
jgi:hypothetical protein